MGDAEYPQILILTADVAEGKFAVADADAAAGAVVNDLGDLVLKLMLHQVVAGSDGGVPSATREISVADKGTNLIGARLENKIGRIELRRRRQIHCRKMGKREKSFLVGLQLQQAADRGQLAVAGIEIDDELRIEVFTRLDAQIADDGRKLVGLAGKGKGRKRIGGLKHVALPGDQSAAEGGIEKIFLRQLPADDLLGGAVFFAAVEALSHSVFELVGVAERFIFIEAHEAGEIGVAGHVTLDNVRLDDVLPLRAGIRRAPDAVERWRADVHRQLLGVAKESLINERTILNLSAVVGGAQGERRRDAQPRAQVQRHGHARGDFTALDEISGAKVGYRVRAMRRV